MKENVLNYTKQYNSFSGADMIANIHIIGPDGNPAIYTLGTLQTITTSLHMDRKPIRSIGNINVKDYVMGPRTIAGTLIFAVFDKHFAYEAIDSILNNNNYDRKFSFLADELPPFDITISFANEYGCKARMAIYGVRLINEGQVMSINDIYTENTYQYVATDIEYINNENGHSSYYSNDNQKIVSKKNNYDDDSSSMNGNELKNNANKIAEQLDSTQSEVFISCKTTNAKNINSLGKVEITLTPPQDKGFISISLHDEIIRTIYMNDFPNELIYMSLKPGQYYCKYQDAENDILTDTNFFIGYDSNTSEGMILSPTALSRTSSSVEIIPNNSEHDTIKYKEHSVPNQIYNSVKIVPNKKTILKNLKSNSFYDIKTYKNNSDDESSSIIIKTLDNNNSKYDYILNQLWNNKNVLNNKNFELYKQVINLCKEQAKKNDYNISILDSFLEAKSIIIKADKKELIDVCNETIDFIEKISNDESYYINSMTDNKKDKQPEIINKINNTVKFNENIKNADLYQYKNGQKIFIKTLNNNKTEENIICEPGYKYDIISKGKYNELNPKEEIYIYSDEEKSNNYKKYKDYIIFKNDIQNNTYKQMQSYIKMDSLNTKIKNRIINQNSKKINYRTLNTPFLKENNDTNVIIDINNLYNLLNQTRRYYLVISNEHDLLKNNIKYKKEIDNKNNELKLNKEFFVLKNEEIYYIWIENEKGIQLSNSYSFKIDNDHNNNYVQTISCLSYIDKLLDKAYNKINKNKEILDDIKFCLCSDDSIKEHDIYKFILNKLNSYSINLKEKEILILKILESKFDIDYYVVNDFFKKHIIKDGNTLIFPKENDFEIIQINFNDMDNIEKNNIINNKIIQNLNYAYSLIYCQSHNSINNKSGFILLNNKTNDFYTYKIDMKEV